VDLWVRSQDRLELKKVKDIVIKKDMANEYYKIYGNDFNGMCLGEYRTMEKALEVLDEIMLRIHQLNMFELGIIRVFDGFTTIYEMPRE
jgi:hypothetical protein